MSHVGAEARYLNYFKRIPAVTTETLATYDKSLNVATQLTIANGSIEAQQRNAKSLFSTAKEMVVGIKTLQDMSGIQYVERLPYPPAGIEESPGKMLGYVQLILRFLQAGLLHSLEEVQRAEERIKAADSRATQLAAYDVEPLALGDIVDIDFESLMRDVDMVPSSSITERPAHVVTDVTKDQSLPISPPKTPTVTPTRPKENKVSSKETKTEVKKSKK